LSVDLRDWQAASTDELIRAYTRVQQPVFVPEVRLYLATELVPLWQATEWRAAAPRPPPFWAFAWPGSLALARYVFDTPDSVAGKRVLDFAAGCGLAAIAAVKLGAARVIACDVDPLASVAQRLNADLNGVTFESVSQDLVDADVDADLVLAGDVCYERDAAERITAWLRMLAGRGTEVLLAEPGRHYAPVEGMELLATYDVPVLRELESADTKRTRVYRLRR
jgi:predicted nicotinamide N-methyase